MTSELSAESTEAVEQDVVSLLANIRRALSERANRPGESYTLAIEVRGYLADMYCSVLRTEVYLREWYGLPDPGQPPRWVRNLTDY